MEFEAALGADTVKGIKKKPPYTYTFKTPFASAPSIALLTMAGVDSNEGAWAQVYGATLATATSLFLSVDEDQIGDTDRKHNHEQVGYLVFAGPLVFTSVVQCDVDADGDGFTPCDGDCNDADPNVFPGAAEACNGVDDNCDGATDEGFDEDGDGVTSCGGDCDDGDPTVFPGAAEACGDGIDNDCNGLVDGADPACSAGPVQVSFTSVGPQDGWIRESSENSNLGEKSDAGGIQAGDDKKDRQYRSILSFDTSSIPNGATILSATLRLRRSGLKGGNPFLSLGLCLVDIRTGGFGGGTSLVLSDFEAVASALAVGSLSNAPSNGDFSQGVLGATGLAAINKTGVTQFRVYFQRDDNDNGSDDYIKYYSGEDATPGNRPALIVVYQE